MWCHIHTDKLLYVFYTVAWQDVQTIAQFKLAWIHNVTFYIYCVMHEAY